MGCFCAMKSGARFAPRPVETRSLPRSETDHVICLGDETNGQTVYFPHRQKPLVISMRPALTVEIFQAVRAVFGELMAAVELLLYD